jgi:UDP:flavonoid glycosyltransferase YjiC (YdhE family)
MIQQAEAAAASEHDPSDGTAAERRHMGHDVPITGNDGLDIENDIPDHPPPAYGEHIGTIANEKAGLGTKADVGDDGRVNIRIDQQNARLSKLLAPALRQQQEFTEHDLAPLPPAYIPPSLGGEEGVPPPPPMQVVIQVVGSRGDVQPFVALGKILKDTYGHRVRLATHPTFKQFVTENGLEFFSIGGDPAELMAFMVKNPGLMPGFDSLRSGDVGNRRKEVAEYIKGCWRSCFESGDGLGPEATNETVENWAWRSQQPSESDISEKPFVADCIIANPPSFAHIHIAEKLGIPLHVMFTMPYSPTQAFPHPLANIQSSNADANLTNYISYALIDMLTWQGLGDVINRFRQKSLGLEPISLVWAPGMLQRLQIPHTYCWSPALIPKPKDWGQNISISGFFFLNLASNYTPAPDLKEFLEAGPPPVYIGFGSIVLDDPNAMTQLIFDAVRLTGQRVLLSKGWGGMGAEELGIPDGVFMLGNCPHDWLFQRVSCVVHHGGAGTTAAGITAGKPTVVVPFFGDQPFWGAMVARAGAGPDPIPHKELTGEKLAEAINFCLKPESQEKAKELASKIAKEKGSDVGAQSFHQNLDVDKLRCTVAPSRTAVWRLKRTQVRLSALAACTLANEGLLNFQDLKLFRAREYETDDGPWDPITGGATALVGTMTQMMMGVADFPIETLKALKIHPEAPRRRKSSQTAGEAPPEGVAGPSRAETTTSSDAPTSADAKTISSFGESRASTDTLPTSTPSSPPASRAGSTFNVQESLDRLQSPPLSQPRLQPRSTSMENALKGGGDGSKSRSRSRSRTGGTAKDYMETGAGTAKGVNRIIGAGFKAPMDFSMALSKGFHNAPKLYGDDTVRKSERVDDFGSGQKAAWKEFGLGMYDGITGLVTQPMRGAQKGGAAGFVKGIGKGIGGVVLKPGAAFFAIPGYTMKGVYKEMSKHFGSSVQNYIIAARTAQGYDEWNASSVEERRDIVARWKHMQKDIKKKRNMDELVKEILDEKKKKLNQGWGEARSRYSAVRMASMGQFNRSSEIPGYEDSQSAALAAEAEGATLDHAQTYQGPQRNVLDHDELDDAIRQSVQETSKGDPYEDAAVERAIRASMTELQKARAERPQQQVADTEDEDLQLALAQSASEAQDQGKSQVVHDEELERVLAQSLRDHRRELGGSTAEEDDDEYHQPIQMVDSSADQPPAYDPGHLSGTTQEQYEAEQSEHPGEKTQQEKTEEQIVMEYVKKQSLLEQQHQKGKGKQPQNDEEDAELQQALKMSMRQGEASGS